MRRGILILSRYRGSCGSRGFGALLAPDNEITKKFRCPVLNSRSQQVVVPHSDAALHRTTWLTSSSWLSGCAIKDLHHPGPKRVLADGYLPRYTVAVADPAKDVQLVEPVVITPVRFHPGRPASSREHTSNSCSLSSFVSE